MDDGSLGSADDTEEIISPPKSRTTSQGAPSPMPPSRDQVATTVTFVHSIGTPSNTIDVHGSFGFITLFYSIFSLIGNMDHMFSLAATSHVPPVPSSPSMYIVYLRMKDIQIVNT